MVELGPKLQDFTYPFVPEFFYPDHMLTGRVGRGGQVDAGVADQLVFGDPKAPRYVYWDRKLRPTPSGPDVLTFDLLTLLGKLRAGLGAIGIKEKAPGTCHLLPISA